MSESDAFWDFYWEVHLQSMEDLGKREAILAVSRYIRRLAVNPVICLRLLELGCGEGQIIRALVEAHSQVEGMARSHGVDYSRKAIQECRRLCPTIAFSELDFTDREQMAGLGQFEIILLVNALHEVFSTSLDFEPGEAAVERAKQKVAASLALAVEHLVPGGCLVIFDGVECEGDIQALISIRFRHWLARRRFEVFAQEYRPFQVTYRETGDPFVIELSYRDFTRYITKSIFLDKPLWQSERLESYQYYNETEFRQTLANLGLAINELHIFTVNYEKWQGEAEIVTAGTDYPNEHILILAQKPKAAEEITPD